MAVLPGQINVSTHFSMQGGLCPLSRVGIKATVRSLLTRIDPSLSAVSGIGFRSAGVSVVGMINNIIISVVVMIGLIIIIDG